MNVEYTLYIFMLIWLFSFWKSPHLTAVSNSYLNMSTRIWPFHVLKNLRKNWSPDAYVRIWHWHAGLSNTGACYRLNFQNCQLSSTLSNTLKRTMHCPFNIERMQLFSTFKIIENVLLHAFKFTLLLLLLLLI